MRILVLLLIITSTCSGQIAEKVYLPQIKTVQLYMFANQLSYPILALNRGDKMELHFDDLDGNVKNYSYTYQLCNADWTPAMITSLDFISGFTQQRLTTYRTSNIALTRYTHYQAILPDRNMVPKVSGNYILKVFLDGDTSKLAFTRRFMVYEDRVAISAQVQQPFNGQIFEPIRNFNSK